MIKKYLCGAILLIMYYSSGCSTTLSKPDKPIVERRLQTVHANPEKAPPIIAKKNLKAAQVRNVPPPDITTQPHANVAQLGAIQNKPQQNQDGFFSLKRISLIWLVIVNLSWFMLGAFLGFFAKKSFFKSDKTPSEPALLQSNIRILRKINH